MRDTGKQNMNTTLREALMAALNQPRYTAETDAMGVLHFVRGWLEVQTEKDDELIAALKQFTETK